MEQNIYKQAILEAKAIRAGAIAQAKASLQEVITPKIQEIVRMKLSEEYAEGEDELEEDYTLEGDSEDSVEEYGPEMEGSNEELDEASLEEILAELEALEEGDETIEEEIDESADLNEEAKEDSDEEEEAEEEKTEEEEEGEESEDEAGEAEEEEVTDETEMVELTLGDLKKVIADLLAQQGEEVADEAPEADIEAGAEDMGGEEDYASLEEILNGLDEKDEFEDKGNTSAFKHNDAYVKELEEAKDTIQSLQETLRDVNLLNAKLLYMNKLFKAKSLSESQKIQVVKAFDRTKNVKEVENTYQTLKESMGVKKTQIKESIGFASKPAGVAPKANIVEADTFVNRWQKLAGIK